MADREIIRPPQIREFPGITQAGFRYLQQLADEINKIRAGTRHGSLYNYSEFESDGTLVFNGDAVVWNDINFPGMDLGVGVTPPDMIEFYGGGGIFGRAFDGSANTEQLFGEGELLHGYKEGTDISFHIHWMPTTADAGNVKWQLTYNWLNDTATGGAPTTISVTSAAGGTAWKHHKTNFADISGLGKTIGSQFHFRLFRDPTDGADTYAHDAGVLSVGIHYEIDTVGSRLVTTK